MQNAHRGQDAPSSAPAKPPGTTAKAAARPPRVSKPAGRAARSHDVTQIYLTEIGRSRLLTAEEEVTLTLKILPPQLPMMRVSLNST